VDVVDVVEDEVVVVVMPRGRRSPRLNRIHSSTRLSSSKDTFMMGPGMPSGPTMTLSPGWSRTWAPLRPASWVDSSG
jgi:hypothetical protein